MADKIKLLMESMQGDMIALFKRRILEKREIKETLQTRERLEYALCKKTCKVKDFLKAIQFEYDLEKLRRERKKSLKYQRDYYADFSIIRRIIQLFDRLTHKFKQRLDLWRQYLVFCYKIHSKKQIAKVLSLALAAHPNNLEFWLMGVYYEFEVQQNPFKARKVFFKALKINGANYAFWKEYFAFEAKFLKLVCDRAALIRKEAGEISKEGETNDDFIGFDGFSRNFLKKTEGLEGASSQEKGSLEVLLTVIETIKARFPWKTAVLDMKRSLKSLDLWEKCAEQLGILADFNEFCKTDGEFAFENLEAENLGLAFEKIEGLQEKIRFSRLFIQRVNEIEKIQDFWRALEDSGVLKEVIEKEKPLLLDFLRELLGKMKKMADSELKSSLYSDIRGFITPIIPANLDFLEISLELSLELPSKTPSSDREFLLKALKTQKNSFSKTLALKVLKSLIALAKKEENLEKNQAFREEILKLGLEYLLLTPELADFINYYLETGDSQEKCRIFEGLSRYKTAIPLEIWLRYCEFIGDEKKKRVTIQQIKAWFPKKLREILEFERDFEEKSGNYVELQRVLYDLSKFKEDLNKKT